MLVLICGIIAGIMEYYIYSNPIMYVVCCERLLGISLFWIVWSSCMCVFFLHFSGTKARATCNRCALNTESARSSLQWRSIDQQIVHRMPHHRMASFNSQNKNKITLPWTCISLTCVVRFTRKHLDFDLRCIGIVYDKSTYIWPSNSWMKIASILCQHNSIPLARRTKRMGTKKRQIIHKFHQIICAQLIYHFQCNIVRHQTFKWIIIILWQLMFILIACIHIVRAATI